MNPDSPFNLTEKHAGKINALLPTCQYVVGIRKNETGEVRFIPEALAWNEGSLYWWSTGHMACDCNRELLFHRQDGVGRNIHITASTGHPPRVHCHEVHCSVGRYTLVGIWFPDGSSLRDLDKLNDL